MKLGVIVEPATLGGNLVHLGIIVSFRTGFAWQKFLEFAAAAVWTDV